MKILIAEADGYAPEALDIYRGLGEVIFGVPGALDRRALLERLEDVDILVVRLRYRVDAALIQAAPRLRAVVSPTTGLDHLDLGALEAAGVKVVSLRGETSFLRSIPATAELTWGLLLAVKRRIVAAARDVQAGAWNRDRHRGSDLAGRTLGILGLGRVGQKVAEYGHAFGMSVLAHDIRPVPRERAQPVGFEALLRRSDVVSLHVPLDPGTRGLVGRGALQLMRPGAVLINTSRGAVVDEAALAEALEAGHLGGAGIDVLENEEIYTEHGIPASHPLRRLLDQHPGLVITPHIAGASFDSMRATEVFCARRLAEQLGDRTRADHER